MKKSITKTNFNLYLQLVILIPFFLSILLILSFNRTPPKNNTFDYKSSFPIILDTLKLHSTFRERNWISAADYDILYLGYEKDTILVHHDTILYKRNTRYYNVYDKYKIYYEAKIQFAVDFSQEIKEDIGLEMDEMSEQLEFRHNSKQKYYSAYPVFIKNQESKPIIIGRTGYREQIPLVLEAKNKNGEWKAIEEEELYLCGVGIEPIILRPQETIVTGVKIYKGTFKTKLRLKYGLIYSDSFDGSINPNQFKKIFNKNGGYSEEYIKYKK